MTLCADLWHMPFQRVSQISREVHALQSVAKAGIAMTITALKGGLFGFYTVIDALVGMDIHESIKFACISAFLIKRKHDCLFIATGSEKRER